MITRRLWLKLRFPPEWHPLYLRVVRSQAETIPWYIWALAVIFFPLLVLPAIFFTATAYSLMWTINVSSAISRERQLGTYDLMCVTPQGELGINWIISTGCFHRNFAFERLHSGGLWFIRIAVGLVLLSTVNNAANLSAGDEAPVMRLAIYAALVVALVVDHYQSVVMSGLIGMLAPTYVKDEILLRLIAPGALVFIQVVSYLLIWLIGFVALPGAVQLIEISAGTYSYGLIALQLAIFILLREGIVFTLWRIMLHRLQSSTLDAVHALDWSTARWL